jgi:hypothetical protein
MLALGLSDDRAVGPPEHRLRGRRPDVDAEDRFVHAVSVLFL